LKETMQAWCQNESVVDNREAAQAKSRDSDVQGPVSRVTM
jgi:hypothetical protein